MKDEAKVKITKNGPYLVSGHLLLAKEIAEVGPSGEPEKWVAEEPYPAQESYALCRCGQSKNKPFCDGSHLKSDFDGKETASRKKHSELAEKNEGPELDLLDVPELCASARFCHLGNGTWNDVEISDDPHSKKNAVRSACNCSAGRLVAIDKETGQAIEPKFKPSISLTQDPQAGVSGPLWLKGGIPLEGADGFRYEKRNRMTLCRCGRSNNKPFCDGAHIRGHFNDGTFDQKD